MLGKLRRGLARSSESLGRGLKTLVRSGGGFDSRDLEELEEVLLASDVGIPVTEKLVDAVKSGRVKGRDVGPREAMHAAVLDILCEVDELLEVRSRPGRPFVILVAGVNGAGKTTTIGKLAARWHAQGFKVLLAAGDTFRAAAVEQLQTWADRVGVEVLSQGQGADPAAVVHDAVAAAVARNFDIVIADTAGRLQTQAGLMAEVGKVKRVMGKALEGAPDEVLLVLDAGLGQNALRQVEEFNAALDLTGLVLTKLDGTARGGVLLAIAESRPIPVRFVGVGEAVDDLIEFDATEYADALLAEMDEPEA